MVSHVMFFINLFLVILLAASQLAADHDLNETTYGSKLWSASMKSEEGHVIEYRPIKEVRYAVLDRSVGGGGRRRLEPFQLCLACRCCSAGSTEPGLCMTLPCCFGIDCALPDKPYGVCAFVPKSCNCTACG